MKKLLLILLTAIMLSCVSLGLTACGENGKDAVSEQLAYVLNEDEQGYAVVGRGSVTSRKIVIPETYNGLPVTAIDNNTFENDLISEIQLTDNIKSIGKYAFYECYSLQSITIGDSVTSIGEKAFYSCGSLQKVYYTGTIDQWAEIDFGGEFSNPLRNAKHLYINDKEVTEVNLTTATKINAYAFYNCQSITKVTVGDSVLSIGNSAFSGCPIKEATIPTMAISYMPETNLQKVVITSGETIGESAFHNCTLLQNVTIGDSVKSIGNYAFYKCTSLQSIIIPDSVKSIGESAFWYCTSLQKVFYKGTSSEWSAISISYNTELNVVTRYYYSETEPTTSGNYWHYDTDGITPVIWTKES